MNKPRMTLCLIRWCICCSAILAAVLLNLSPTSVGPLSTAKARGERVASEDLLARIKKAHIISDVQSSVFDSYRLTGCMYIDQHRLPKTINKLKTECIKEETGVLQPSFSYVSIVIGSMRIIQLIDMNQARGWQITNTPTNGDLAKPLRTVLELQQMKYEAMVENTRHSLVAFLGILNADGQRTNSNFEVSSGKDGVVVSWQTSDSLNQFFFNKDSLLCEKQVRTIGDATTTLKFSNYKSVANVMLPHSIVVETKEGKTLANREVQHWGLATDWPKDYFTPDNVNAFE